MMQQPAAMVIRHFRALRVSLLAVGRKDAASTASIDFGRNLGGDHLSSVFSSLCVCTSSKNSPLAFIAIALENQDHYGNASWIPSPNNQQTAS